jgi:hypothetical protein
MDKNGSKLKWPANLKKWPELGCIRYEIEKIFLAKSNK